MDSNDVIDPTHFKGCSANVAHIGQIIDSHFIIWMNSGQIYFLICTIYYGGPGYVGPHTPSKNSVLYRVWCISVGPIYYGPT